MYKLQESRYGGEWEDVSWLEPTDDLGALIREGDDAGHQFAGWYDFRIIDANEAVVWTAICAYESVYLNLASSGWFENIRRDYKLSEEVWKQACKHWLAANED